MNIIDLFAGAGGFSKAIIDAGAQVNTHYFSEIKPSAINNYLYNFPNSIPLGDITQISAASIQNKVDIITFGSPCQGLSMAGKGEGFNDPRSGLFLHAARLVAELRPSVFVWENVKGLITRKHRKDFWTALQILTNIGGYRLEFQCVDTGWILPQHRERIYLVGRLGADRQRKVFPITESDFGFVVQERKAQSEGERLRGYHSRANTLLERYYKDGSDNLIKIINGAHGGFKGSISDIAPTLNVCSTKSNVAVLRLREYSKGKSQGSRVYAIDGISPTLNNSSGGLGVQSPLIDLGDYDIRRLTPTECERLQGFPDGWTKFGIHPKTKQVYELSDTARYQLMGNAITKTMAETIFRKILTNQ